jgi:hypothetical protein
MGPCAEVHAGVPGGGGAHAPRAGRVGDREREPARPGLGDVVVRQTEVDAGERAARRARSTRRFVRLKRELRCVAEEKLSLQGCQRMLAIAGWRYEPRRRQPAKAFAHGTAAVIELLAAEV